MLRITINKEVADVSLKTLILPEYWDKQRKRIMKTAPDAHAINTYLNEVYTTLHYYYKQELLSSRHISANLLKQRFLLIGATPPSLLELFMRQEEDARKLLSANKISISHYNKHRLVYQRLDEFCKKNGINDMALDQFNRQTIHDLEIFFKTDCSLSVNSTAKMLEFIRKGILWAYQCGLILINPFAAYRIKKRRCTNPVPEQTGNIKNQKENNRYPQTGFCPRLVYFQLLYGHILCRHVQINERPNCI
ncbi:phage integrase SAM-like domain and Arm DNA-binding domain-containing protein [Bacteroides fragilis]